MPLIYDYPLFQTTDMKKTLTLFLFSMLGLCLQAQDFYVVDSLYCYIYHPVSQAATPTERQYNLAFSDKGEVLESRKEERPSWLGLWRNKTLTNYSFDTQGNLVEHTEQRWDTLASNWINDKRTQNTPNANGGFTQVLNQQWSNGAWQNIDRIISSFNANGHIETLAQELWDAGLNAWKKNFRIVYATNAQGQFIQTKFQFWNQAAGNYYDVSRTTYTYNTQNPSLEAENITEIYNAVSSQWDKSSRSVKGYDSNGNRTEETTQLWNNVNNDWLNQNRIVQNFNANKKVTLRTELVWNGTQWVNFFQTNNVYDANENLTRFEVFQWQVNQWKLLNSCDFFWRFHHEVLSTGTVQPAVCRIPNPYKPGTPFFCEALQAERFDRLALYDLTGRMAWIEKIENQHFINIPASVPAGMYVLKLSGEKGLFYTQKIIIH
jgi:hypothetical protein